MADHFLILCTAEYGTLFHINLRAQGKGVVTPTLPGNYLKGKTQLSCRSGASATDTVHQ